jgi:hypothetical protein
LSSLSEGSSAAIRQALKPFIFVPIKDFAAFFLGDIELPTQLGPLRSFKQASHETKMLIHLATLPPWHLRVSRKCRKE